MPKSYVQLQQQINALEAQAEQARKLEVAGVIARMREAITAYGITPEELFGSSTARTARVRSSKPRGARGVKYGDGQGNTWGGMGKRPQWLRDALANGRALADFELKIGSPSASRQRPNTKRGAPAKPSGGAKALYRDDQGNSWGGRGPRPRWLKDALASGKTLDELRSR